MAKKKRIKFQTEELLRSEPLSHYQKDFAKAVLTKAEYTLPEAIEELDKVLGKEKEEYGRRNMEQPK